MERSSRDDYGENKRAVAIMERTFVGYVRRIFKRKWSVVFLEERRFR